MSINQEIYDLAVKVWYALAPATAKAGGHPGVQGPSSTEAYDEERALLESARDTLAQAVTFRDPFYCPVNIVTDDFRDRIQQEVQQEPPRWPRDVTSPRPDQQPMTLPAITVPAYTFPVKARNFRKVLKP